jgi:hypothetical protein
MDTTTVFDVIEFRQNYGIAYKMPSSEVPVIDEVLNNQTISLLNKILQVNNAAVIKSDLLLQTEVQPSALIPNSTRGLSKIEAVRDYRAKNTAVSVYYDGGLIEKFTTIVVSPNRSVAAAIADKLNRPLADITPVIKYDSLYGKDFKKVTLIVYSPFSLTLDILYVDGTSEGKSVSNLDIDSFIQYQYNGDTLAYKAEFDSYVEEIKKGDLTNIHQLVAGALGRSIDEVKKVLIINVGYYNPNDDGACLHGCGA